MNNLRRLDLNLLLTLDALLAEHSVTRAAQRLHYSQPSVSVQLAKLRAVFNDPLLLPGPRGMRPTARAEALRAPLQQALAALAQAVAPASPFDPSVAGDTWRIAAADYGETTILLPALASLRGMAPGTRLAVLPLAPARLTRQFEQGEVDLALHTRDGAPPGLHQRLLLSERYVLAGRRAHPRLQRRPTLAQFCRLEHAIVSPAGGAFAGNTDAMLAEQGLQRRVALSVPHFLHLRELIACTDLVAMLPARLVQNRSELRVHEPPLAVPGFEMLMLWHERSHRDPAHAWLRAQIAAAQEG